MCVNGWSKDGGVAVLTSVQVREAVERSKLRFVEACAGSTDEQWQFQPAGSGQDARTMPQVVEHVTFANEGVLGLLRDIVVKSPLDDQRLDYEDDDMPYLFYGGAGPAPPGGEEPTGTRNRIESVCAFTASMDAIMDWYERTDVDLRQCALRHPTLGVFDGAQWLLFAAVHAHSHRGQLLDLRLACDAAHAAASEA
jgi:hypothetical protein